MSIVFEDSDVSDISEDELDISSSESESEEQDDIDKVDNEDSEEDYSDFDGVEDECGDGEDGMNFVDIHDYDKRVVKGNYSKSRKSKNTKVAKSTKKGIPIERCREYLNCDLRKKITNSIPIDDDEIKKNIEKNIFNCTLRKYEKEFGTKMKKKELNGNYFKENYLSVSYEILFKIESGRSIEDIISELKFDKIGLKDKNLEPEIFIDEKETKNIEEPPKVKPGIHRCNKCYYNKDKKDDVDRGKRTWFYELQTRSSDEPMTCFITCLDCGFKWKQ